MIIRNKKSAQYLARHSQDVYTDLGYDYRKNIFKNTLSNVILQNKNNKSILSHIEKMIVKLIDNVKQIRLQFMISLDKNDTHVN